MTERSARSGFLALCAMLLLGIAGQADAARTSDVRGTKHNLSSSGTGTVKATAAAETQICVFCHTPHNADATSPAPLWNKTFATKTYEVYTSGSLDAETIRGALLEAPMGSSKLCLSCHDGAMALGSVRVLRGQLNQTIGMTGAGTGGVMPDGKLQDGTATGKTTGYTRNLGGGSLGQSGPFDLKNDHPISVTYDAALASRDGELRTLDVNQQSALTVGTHPLVGKRAAGQGPVRPVLPLDPTGTSGAGQVQCTTCHDPHIKGDGADVASEGNIKFLRRPRVQTGTPADTYNDGGDIMCLACHNKGQQGKLGNTWAYSAHANPSVATQTYRSGASSAARTRDFPDNIQVWQASCLNCHDTHTVTGSRRLLREGSDASPAATLASGGFKAGGNSALEETCYQCHRDSAGSILSTSTTVPNIRDDFQLSYHMPITSGDQDAGATVEAHDPGSGRSGFNDGYVGGVVNGATTSGSNCTNNTNDKCGADLVESRTLLGITATNRHVECTDCHNPHRVAKNKLFYGSNGSVQNPDASGTHTHTDTNMTHTNLASGVLRGTWGVEPLSYANNSFHSSVLNWTVRRGDPGSETPNNGTTMPLNSNMDTNGFVTREYQVCLKCHSNYGHSTPGGTLTTGYWPLRASGSRRGLTATATNGLTDYTDQAKEFQAPTSHATESTSSTTVSLGHDGGANNGSASYPPVDNSSPFAVGSSYNSHGFNTHNHRSWHPVMRSTGRTISLRSISTGNPWYRPWSNAVGSQTMYCSDCHGSAVTSGAGVKSDGSGAGGSTGLGTVIPNGGENGNPWGPHGSANPFILKGEWASVQVSTSSTTFLCFKCHDPAQYTPSGNDNSDLSSGFCCDNKGNLHKYHRTRIGSNLKCSWCHVAVPHGWKNKALLVNLNDVGYEAGFATSTEVSLSTTDSDSYTKAPYYLNAKLKVRNFARSGQWAKDSCNAAGKEASLRTNNTSNGTSGNQIGGGSGKETEGLEWMKTTCASPP